VFGYVLVVALALALVCVALVCDVLHVYEFACVLLFLSFLAAQVLVSYRIVGVALYVAVHILFCLFLDKFC